jgi:hypothetical protein
MICFFLAQPVVSHAREGKFRAVVAIATHYSNNLLPQPALIKSLPIIDSALRAYATQAGYETKQIDIRYYTDVDGAFTKDGRSTDNEIKTAVWDAADNATLPEDTLIFFFSGHGGSNGKTSVLYTSGADGYRPISRIILESEIMSEAWRRSQAGVKLIVLDACQTPAPDALSSAPPLMSLGTLAKLRETEGQPQPGSQGTAILLAADEGKSAWVNDELGYGFFTHRFAEALRSAQYNTVLQLFTAIRDKVIRDARAKNREQNPRIDFISSLGDYQLIWGSAKASTTAPLPISAAPARALTDPSSVSMTSLRASATTIYDTSSGLLWIRDLTLLGSTPQVFSKTIQGTASIKGSFLELQEKVRQLSFAGISGWRLAQWPELQTLRGAGEGSLFFAFQRSKSRFQDLIGVYQAHDGQFNLWGYQYQNTLVGPFNWGAGDPTLNDYGVWIVAGPTSLPAANTEAIPELREPRVEQTLSPVISGIITNSAGQITAAQLPDGSLGVAGNLGGEQQAVFEYALKPLATNAFVRAEIELEGAMASGTDPTVEISVYKGDGVLQPSIFLSQLGTSAQDTTNTTKWIFTSRSRVEIPSHLARNSLTLGELIGIRIRYVGPNGSVHFAIPKLIVTYVSQSALLSRREEFVARQKETTK